MAPSLVYTSGVTTMNNFIWSDWNYQYVIPYGSVTTGGACWPLWNQAYTTGASATTVTFANGPNVWHVWCEVQETVEQRRLREQEQIQRQARTIHVESVAKNLLLRHLNRQQREQFEREKVFEVIGAKGNRRYRIDGQGGVKLVDDQGRAVESYCIHPSYDREEHMIPTPDLILAKKLMLEHDEERFLKTANATRLRVA